MDLRQMLTKFRERPHRVWEAIVVLLGAGGVTLIPEAEAAVISVIGLLVTTGVIGSEVAQTKTTSLANPRDAEGRALTPDNNPPE